MKTKPYLSLEDIKKIAAGCEAHAIANKWNVSFAIVDDGGHTLWLQRLDGAAPASAEIAPAKARLAAIGRRETKMYEDMVNGGRTSFLTAMVSTNIRGATLEGGIPVMVDGQCAGAVGVSGVTSAQDAEIAAAGIAKLS